MIKTLEERLSHLDRPTDFAIATHARNMANELRAALQERDAEIETLKAEVDLYCSACGRRDVELDALRADAERYRWICQQDHKDSQWVDSFGDYKAARDAHLDQRMKGAS